MSTDLPIVLIVDDQPINLQHLAEVLDSDYRVKVTTSGRAAVELARRPPYPEVILLDVMMPEMDGYAVCAALKQDPLTADIPIIFITAQTDTESETSAIQAGAVDFIHKPINPEVVRARVHLQHELARHRNHLEDLVQERTRELVQAREVAESASRAKSAFLANVSHEMHTPLHHITAMIYLLDELLPEGKARERLAVIDKAAQGLLALVKNLLELTRLEAGEVRLEPQPFAVRRLAEQALEERRSAATAKGLNLIAQVEPEVPERLVGDPARLRQILVQLLDNAVKFSEQGEIRLRIRAGERQGQRLRLYFEVKDEGMGVDPILVEHIFKLFHSGDDSSTRRHGGLGLGLGLCQRLVELMLGEIELTSDLDQGTTIRFWVPLEITH